MENRVINVFYGTDLLPYKDSDRTVHYPVTSSTFAGSNNVNEIHFYVDQIGGVDSVSWVVVSKLPNGKLGYEPISTLGYDEDLEVYYLVFTLSSYYTQTKGILKLALRGYNGEITFTLSDDTYSISGDPLVEVTGTIDFAINYSPFVNKTTSLTQDEYLLFISALSNYIQKVSGILIVDDISDESASDYNEGQVLFSKSDMLFYIVSSSAFAQYDIVADPITTYDYSDTALQGIKIHNTEYRLAPLGSVYDNGCVAIGNSSNANAEETNAIGFYAEVNGNYGTAIGSSACCEGDQSIAIGSYAQSFLRKEVCFDDFEDGELGVVRTLNLYSAENIFFRNEGVSDTYTDFSDYENGQTLKDYIETFNIVEIIETSGTFDDDEYAKLELGGATIVDTTNAVWYHYDKDDSTYLYFKAMSESTTSSGATTITRQYIRVNKSTYAYTLLSETLLNTYTADEIDTKLTSMLVYKGSLTVDEISALDTSELETGYFYNVSDSGTITWTYDSTSYTLEVLSGDNIAWTGSSWDKLTMDLSVYDDKFISAGFFEVEDYDETTGEITFVYASDLYEMSYDSTTGVLTITAS